MALFEQLSNYEKLSTKINHISKGYKRPDKINKN